MAVRREDSIPERERRHPKRGRTGVDVKQVQLPEAAYKALYVFARAHNLTFGDAAAHLIGTGMLHINHARMDDAQTRPSLGGTGKQVKIPVSAHSLLYVFAQQYSMNLRDAAALLIGVGLTKHYRLNEDATTRQGRVARKERLRSVGEALAHIERQERYQEDNTGHGPSDT